MASEAERLAAGTGWLPVMFRGQGASAEPQVPEGKTDVDAEACGGVEAEVLEDMHA